MFLVYVFSFHADASSHPEYTSLDISEQQLFFATSIMAGMPLDPEVLDATADLHTYLDDVRLALVSELGDDLCGIYLFGSVGNDSYEPGISDVDIYTII